MPATIDDWRLHGQERYLEGAAPSGAVSQARRGMGTRPLRVLLGTLRRGRLPRRAARGFHHGRGRPLDLPPLLPRLRGAVRLGRREVRVNGGVMGHHRLRPRRDDAALLPLLLHCLGTRCARGCTPRQARPSVPATTDSLMARSNGEAGFKERLQDDHWCWKRLRTPFRLPSALEAVSESSRRRCRERLRTPLRRRCWKRFRTPSRRRC